MARVKGRQESNLRRGDQVMVISGGNRTKRPLIGKVAKIVRFVGAARDRVILDGLNMITRHQRATGPKSQAGRVQREAGVHVSNVMFYAEKYKKPVRLRCKVLENGKKVRGFFAPGKGGEFEQIDVAK